MPSPDQTSSEKEWPRSSSSHGWEKRIFVPTLLAGFVGGIGGIFSKHREAFGVANLCATYAANLSIVTGCYSGARELTRELRASEDGDLLNSVIGGLTSGAFLGRLQGGQVGGVRYAIIFACTGSALDYAVLQMKSRMESNKDPVSVSEENSQQKSEKKSWWSWPEWAPIQVYDEETEAKKEQEKRFFAQRRVVKMDKTAD